MRARGPTSPAPAKPLALYEVRGWLCVRRATCSILNRRSTRASLARRYPPARPDPTLDGMHTPYVCPKNLFPSTSGMGQGLGLLALVSALHLLGCGLEGAPEMRLSKSDGLTQSHSVREEQDPAPTLYREMQAGSFNDCALKTDGTVACWGTTTTASPRRRPAASRGSARACPMSVDWMRRGLSRVGGMISTAVSVTPTKGLGCHRRVGWARRYVHDLPARRMRLGRMGGRGRVASSCAPSGWRGRAALIGHTPAYAALSSGAWACGQPRPGTQHHDSCGGSCSDAS